MLTILKILKILKIVKILKILKIFRVSETSYSKRILPPRLHVVGIILQNLNCFLLRSKPDQPNPNSNSIIRKMPQEIDLPLDFGLAGQRWICAAPLLDFSQVLPLIRVSNKCYIGENNKKTFRRRELECQCHHSSN